MLLKNMLILKIIFVSFRKTIVAFSINSVAFFNIKKLSYVVYVYSTMHFSEKNSKKNIFRNNVKQMPQISMAITIKHFSFFLI
jgi:hypothetical protein